MTSESLLKSWQRTKAILLEARATVSQAAEGICADEIADFHDYLEHNELELALDMLDQVFEKSPAESFLLIELMARSAASMGLVERQQLYDKQLTDARGWEYHTEL